MNLIANGGFETDVTGWTGAKGAETLTQDTGEYKFGAASMKVVTPGSVNYEGALHAITGGVKKGRWYDVEVWVKGPAASPYRLLLYGSGINGNVIGTYSGVWERLTRSVLATGTGAANLYLDTGANAVAITVYMDGVQVGETPNPARSLLR